MISNIERVRPREKLDPAKTRVMLINMEGEGGLSLHEPIGVEAIAGRLRRDLGITPEMHDTQPELFTTGKIDTNRLVKRVQNFVDSSKNPNATNIVGFSVPIYSYDYFKSTLIKLEQDPPENPFNIVMGNALATYTAPELIHKDFPYVTIVKGEGDESFPKIVEQMTRGEEVRSVIGPSLPNLRNYAQPYRVHTKDIHDLGGSIKVEASRGCDFGACTFCSRDLKIGRRGLDYRAVPEDVILPQVTELLDTYNVTRFELTDEEAFGGDLEATGRLVSAWKSSDVPRTPFSASLRVETIVKLQQEGLLEQLQEIGLDKVFLGVEGGSDAYLKQIGKGQKVSEVYKSLDIVKNATWKDEAGKEKSLDMEMGFITFSWRMNKNMLRDNITFLSNNNVYPYVSSLFNLLEVRAGTLDETLLHRYAQNGTIKDYDPQANFSINASCYRDTPFLDPEVGKIYKEAEAFSSADESLYYAVKSVNRAASLPPETHDQAKRFYLNMKNLHLRYLRDAVGLEPDPNVAEKRHALITEMKDTFGIDHRGDTLDSVRREIHTFLQQEEERQHASGDQVGAMAVCANTEGKILLVRPRYQESWAFPGGNLKPGESIEDAVVREAKEEIGVNNVIINNRLPDVVKTDHFDMTTGQRPKLTLHHVSALLEGEIDIHKTDHEIADTIWLSPNEILEEKVKTRENVQEIVRFLKSADRATTAQEHTIFYGQQQ